jgi:hypothetical protein
MPAGQRKAHKRHNVPAMPTKERGRDLAGDGISYKCRTGRCQDCTAMKCTHDCGHGGVDAFQAVQTDAAKLSRRV